MPTVTLKPNEVKALPLTAIKPDPENIRKYFEPESLKQLADDIKLRGLEQPIIVTKNGTGYTIKHGERRYRATQLAKLKTINCILAPDDKSDDADFKRLMDQYAENMLRADLNPIDMAHFFRRCRDDYEMKVTEIPEMLKNYGMKKVYDRTTISNMIRLTELPDWAQDMIKDGRLTGAHGRVLTSIIGLDEKFRHSVKEQIEEVLEDIATTEQEHYTVNDLAEDIHSLARNHFRRAWKTHIFEYTDLDDEDSVLYDPEKLSDAEKQKLGLVNIPSSHNGRPVPYITNLDAHKEMNLQARAAILAQRTKATEKKKKAAAKQTDVKAGEVPANTGPSEKGLIPYMLKWLQTAINKRLDNIETTEPIFERLMFWCAFSAPSMPGYMSYSNFLAGTDSRAAVKQSGHQSLKSFLEDKIDDVSLMAILANKAVEVCDLEHRCYLAKHLGIDIDSEFRINDEYLQLYRKAGLLQLAIDAGIDVTTGDKASLRLDKRPVGELRQALVEQYADKIGCPGHVTLFIDEQVKCYEEALQEAIENAVDDDDEDEQQAA